MRNGQVGEGRAALRDVVQTLAGDVGAPAQVDDGEIPAVLGDKFHGVVVYTPAIRQIESAKIRISGHDVRNAQIGDSIVPG